MAPSSYAEQYIEYLAKQGKYLPVEGTEALKPEESIPVPTRTAVRKENRRERELATIVTQLPEKVVTTPVLIRRTRIRSRTNMARRTPTSKNTLMMLNRVRPLPVSSR